MMWKSQHRLGCGRVLFTLGMLIVLASCGAPPTSQASPVPPTIPPTVAPTVEPTPTPSPEPTPTALPAPTPVVELVMQAPDNKVTVGQAVPIFIQVTPPQPLDLSWSVSGTAEGVLSTYTGQTVIYTAAKPGADFVIAEGTMADGTPIDQKIVIEVAPDTTALAPLSEIFPQAGDGSVSFRFTNPPDDLSFVADFDDETSCSNSGPFGLKLEYNFQGKDNGGWGVHWEFAAEQRFDASQFTAITFFVKGTAPEGFNLGIKDTNEQEFRVNTDAFVKVNEGKWQRASIPLVLFANGDPPVDLANVRNINFGFNVNHGEGSICIDDIAFR